MRPIKLTEEKLKILRGIFSKESFARVVKNARKVDVFRFEYNSNEHTVIGYLVQPKRIKGKLPCIIFNRGGSLDFGIIKLGQLFTEFADMAQWGYVVIASQYSGCAGSESKDEFGGSDLADVLNLKKILNKHPHADVSRIGMFGGSRGGMMTYLALASVKWIKAAVTIGATADLARNAKERPEMKERFKECFGGSVFEMKRRSAVHFVKSFSKRAPLLMMHGTADWRVSPLDSLELSKELFIHKIPHRLIMFEGGDHGLTEFRNEVMFQKRAWFDTYLKDDSPLPDLKPHGL